MTEQTQEVRSTSSSGLTDEEMHRLIQQVTDAVWERLGQEFMERRYTG